MKIQHLSFALFCIFLSGCMTTQDRRDKRITQNIDLFYEYTEGERAKIRRGDIDIGFNEDMVYLAIGKADRVARLRNTDGESVTWQYFRHIHHSDYDTIRMPVTWVDEQGRSHIRYDYVTVDRSWSERQLKTQIEFENGQVVSVETMDGY